MKKELFLCLLLLLTATTFCRKEKEVRRTCGTAHTAYITSADLLKLKFKEDSYWVFTDSVTNQTDSVRVSGSSTGFIYDDCQNGYDSHRFGTVSYPSAKTTSYIVVQGGLFKGYNGQVNSGTCIFGSAASGTNYTAIWLDSLFVYNQYYAKVLKVQIDKDPTESGNKSVYYINSEQGFLRHDIYTDTTLSTQKILMRKKIIW